MDQATAESMPMGTQAQPEHAWLNQLVGEWKVETRMKMGPEGPEANSTGSESMRRLGPLWVVGEGTSDMPDGGRMEYRTGLGYDVSFKHYGGFWIADMSSHHWKYIGEMSEDQRMLTLNCEGPDMMEDGKTANYRDVIELVDADHRTLTSYGQDKDGNWHPFMWASYTRVG